MSAITYRSFSRNSHKIMICFAENMTDDYEQGELLNESDGGIAFLSARELRPGSGILIKLADSPAAGNACAVHPDHFAEVRWCVKADEETDRGYRVGVRIFTRTCMLCGAAIHQRDIDNPDLCESCHDRFCSMTDGGGESTKSCIEKVLIGNVI